MDKSKIINQDVFSNTLTTRNSTIPSNKSKKESHINFFKISDKLLIKKQSYPIDVKSKVDTNNELNYKILEEKHNQIRIKDEAHLLKRKLTLEKKTKEIDFYNSTKTHNLNRHKLTHRLNSIQDSSPNEYKTKMNKNQFKEIPEEHSESYRRSKTSQDFKSKGISNRILLFQETNPPKLKYKPIFYNRRKIEKLVQRINEVKDIADLKPDKFEILPNFVRQFGDEIKVMNYKTELNKKTDTISNPNQKKKGTFTKIKSEDLNKDNMNRKFKSTDVSKSHANRTKNFNSTKTFLDIKNTNFPKLSYINTNDSNPDTHNRIKTQNLQLLDKISKECEIDRKSARQNKMSLDKSDKFEDDSKRSSISIPLISKIEMSKVNNNESKRETKKSLISVKGRNEKCIVKIKDFFNLSDSSNVNMSNTFKTNIISNQNAQYGSLVPDLINTNFNNGFTQLSNLKYGNLRDNMTDYINLEELKQDLQKLPTEILAKKKLEKRLELLQTVYKDSDLNKKKEILKKSKIRFSVKEYQREILALLKPKISPSDFAKLRSLQKSDNILFETKFIKKSHWNDYLQSLDKIKNDIIAKERNIYYLMKSDGFKCRYNWINELLIIERMIKSKANELDKMDKEANHGKDFNRRLTMSEKLSARFDELNLVTDETNKEPKMHYKQPKLKGGDTFFLTNRSNGS